MQRLLLTTNLTFRRAQNCDLELFRALYCNPETMRNLGGEPFTESQLDKRIAQWDSHWEKHGWGGGVIVSRQTEKHIGTAKICYTDLPDQLGHIEIGFMILAEFQRRGYATEISKALIQFAFENLAATRIVADAAPENAPSNCLLANLGFSDEGVREYEYEESAKKELLRIWVLDRKI